MVRLGSLLALIGMAFWLHAAPAYASKDGAPKPDTSDHSKSGSGGGSPPAGGGDSTHDGSKGLRVDGTYFMIAPIIITVFQKNGSVGRLSAVFTLELASEAAVAAAAPQHSKLRDALIRELHRLAEREVRNGREYTVGQIRRRAKVIVTKQLGEEAVLDVLVQALTRG